MGKKSKHKEKKKKHHKHKRSSANGTEETASDTVPAAEAAEASDVETGVSPHIVREDWMTKPKEGWLSGPSRRQASKSKEDAKEAKHDSPKPGLYVPEGSKVQTGEKRSTVGDGGASWRLRALKRMQQRGQMENKSVEQIAEERGMNLELLKSEAERPSSARRRSKMHHSLDRPYLNDIYSPRRDMKRPQTEKSSFSRRREKSMEESEKEHSFPSSMQTSTGFNKFPSDGSFFQMFSQSSGQHERAEKLGIEPKSSPPALGNASIAQKLREQMTSGAFVQEGDRQPSDRAEPVKKPMIVTHKCSAPGVRGREDSSKKRRDLEEAADVMTLYKRSRCRDDAFDINRTLAKNISRDRRFNNREDLDADLEYEYGVGADLFEKRGKKNRRETLTDVQRRERRCLLKAEQRQQTLQDRCIYCFDGPFIPKHLVVSLATTSYLRLPQDGALDPLHCYIVPLEHIPSTREVDDDAWTEIRNFKKALIQMSQSKGRSCIFLETAMHLEDRSRHAFVECIPVEARLLERAPMYYKKAIDDATSDWSQHHAKRCIETGSKGLRGSIPAHFPYFHVEFNLSRGFVHVIDDEANFDANLGRRVLIGLLNRPAEEMYQRMDQTSIEQQRTSVQVFLKQWHDYDWTLQL